MCIENVHMIWINNSGKVKKENIFCIDIDAADRFYPKCNLLNYIDSSLSVMYLTLSLDRSTLICDRLGKMYGIMQLIYFILLVWNEV